MNKELRKLLEEVLNEGYGLKNILSDIFTSYPNEVKTVLTKILDNTKQTK